MKRLEIDSEVAEFLLYMNDEKFMDFIGNLLVWIITDGKKDENLSFKFRTNQLLFRFLHDRIKSANRAASTAAFTASSITG